MNSKPIPNRALPEGWTPGGVTDEWSYDPAETVQSVLFLVLLITGCVLGFGLELMLSWL